MKKTLTIVLAVVMLLSLVACGSKTAAAPAAPAAEKAAEAAPVAAPSAETTDAKTYYYVAPYMGHPYIYDQFLGLKHAAEEFQCNVVQLGPDGWDTQAATEAFEQAIAKKPDGIITVMWDGSLIPAAKTAMEQGIPVIVIETAPNDHGCLSYLGIDNYQCGVDTAKALVNLKGNSGKVVLQGNWGASNTDEKLAGVKDFLATTDWEIVAEVNDESDTEKAIEVAKAAYNNYEVDAFIGLTSASGPGIAAAMEELGVAPEDIAIACNDREDMTLEYIKAGYIDVTICNKTAMQAYMAVALLEMYYEYGLDVVPISADNAAANVNVFPAQILNGGFTITAENVDDFLHENMGSYETEFYKN